MGILPNTPTEGPANTENWLAIEKRTLELEGKFATKAELETDSEGALRLVTPGATKINFGTADVGWPGLSRESTGTTVSHGLGVVPKSIQLTPRANGKFISVPVIGEVTTTTFIFVGYVFEVTPPLASEAQAFYWQAIG